MLFTDEESFLERFNTLEDEETYRSCVESLYALVEQGYSPSAFERSMEAVVESLLRDTGER
jgi:hypothetical protein